MRAHRAGTLVSWSVVLLITMSPPRPTTRSVPAPPIRMLGPPPPNSMSIPFPPTRTVGASPALKMWFGDRHDTVRRLYRGLMVLEQAEWTGAFDRKDRWNTRFAY